MDAALLARALDALRHLEPDAQLDAAAHRLRGSRAGPLAAIEAGDERDPSPDRIDGSLLDAVAHRALDGARGAVFTAAPEACLLAALGLARVAARRGVAEAEALAALLGEGGATPALARALDGVRVLDFACGGGALLAAAHLAAARAGARPLLLGLEIAPLAARAARARLALLGAEARIEAVDALVAGWPECDLVLANPPFLRHESIAPRDKARASRASGLSRQADLSAHLAALALRHAPDVALVWPRALDTARSAAPVVAEARARGGFAFRLRSRAAGSFAASIDTVLAVWSHGHPGRAAAEAAVPLAALHPREVVAMARGVSSPRLRSMAASATAPAGALTVGDVCEVRFGLKSGCNGFFHLTPCGGDRFLAALAGEVRLAASDVAPLLASLKEASAPEVAAPARVIFRPSRETATSRAYVARGAALGVPRRPTCAGRSPWWRIAPGRGAAPVLYPAKVGARAFAFLNEAALLEDKKWHALFPRADLEPWVLAAILSSSPVRLAIDAAARQLTGSQAIADIDCNVLARAPFPALPALAPLLPALARARTALARDTVTTDVRGMLARPAQEELDRIAGEALGLAPADVARARSEVAERVEARLAHAGAVRRLLAAS